VDVCTTLRLPLPTTLGVTTRWVPSNVIDASSPVPKMTLLLSASVTAVNVASPGVTLPILVKVASVAVMPDPSM